MPAITTHGGLQKSGYSRTFGIADSFQTRIKEDCFLWNVCRYLSRNSVLKSDNYVPGFTAIRSKFAPPFFHPTDNAYVPVLPYKATERDSIFTTMVNFQDVLKQYGQNYGSLWCDEGVYCVAKEIQFLQPETFSNLFLGLGGFHFEKIVYGCIGSYLEPSGISSVLVATQCVCTEVMKSVMEGTDYVRSKEGLSRIHEALFTLMLEQFLVDTENVLDVKRITDLISNNYSTWDTIIEEYTSSLNVAFMKYLDERREASQNFWYWYNFIFNIYPIARDLSQSFRIGNWNGYVTSVERSLPLFFAYGRTNYLRFAPIFFEDCMDLKSKFPLLYESFVNGGFVVNRNRHGSGTPMDQALERVYNKTAKGEGGVSGFTRRKEAVALWNILKHEKECYTSNMRSEGQRNTLDGETTLHHDYSKSNAKSSSQVVGLIVEYVKKICNPLSKDLNGEPMRNIVTGKEDMGAFSFSIYSLDQGHDLYHEYLDKRLIMKTVGLFDTISRNKQKKQSVGKNKAIDVNKETIRVMKYIEYAKFRGYDTSDLLKFEIASVPLYLVDPDDGLLKDSSKSILSKELLEKISFIPDIPLVEFYCSSLYGIRKKSTNQKDQ